MKISEPPPAPSKPAPDALTSVAAKHEEEHGEETAEERAKREAELKKIYADLAKEDDRCLPIHELCPTADALTAKLQPSGQDCVFTTLSKTDLCLFCFDVLMWWTL